ncbi:Spermatogenesis-associated 17 [Brachionus plicatilis]|uniref:Spermatogenesis-associated 17 n=1 Tax=Brachionus plicatilis TaxID=10195 RepID=A0A3M7PNT7_BRAPC|nr:Spermatogenesis-associated 17 [Brachionus plicatilis]
MARIIELIKQVPNIIDEIYENSRKADQFRYIENEAAIKIQSWYRGLKVRTYMKHLNKNATVIQKIWRGYQGRRKYRIQLEERVRQMRLEFYHEKAILIQKIWRGYYSRKYVFNYYKRKAYLKAIEQKNEIVLNELREYKDYMDKQEEERKHIQRYRQLEKEAKKNHYLISTKQIPGIYNSPYKPTASEMEYILKTVKLEPSEKHDLYVQSLKANKFDSVALPDYLPPLSNKQQGPFRDPLEVRKQRYRPFSPSLRVETDYEGLEKARKNLKSKEWTERLHDDIFYPIDKTIYKKPYDPLMLTKSKFGSLNYGTQHFREEAKPNEWKGNVRFKSLVPPVPEFNKLNKTYIDSHYYLS